MEHSSNTSASRRLENLYSHLSNASSSLEAQETHAGGGCPAKRCPVVSGGCSCCSGNGTKAIRVCVTGAAGQIGYSLLPLIASGLMLGRNQPIKLNLLEIAPALKSLQGVALELQDGAYDLLEEVICSSDPLVAFKDVDIAILVGSFPRKKDMERKELMEKNAAIFREQGSAIDKVASRDVKVVVVGNPANTNCAIAQACAPSIPKQNFTALTRLDWNRARSLLAEKLKVKPGQVVNVILWGNHSSTQYPDVNHAYVSSNGQQTPVRKAINDDNYLNTGFISRVQKRGAEIIEMRGLSSAMSAANAVVEHVRDWILGTRKNHYVSMAIPSDGSYGVPKDIIYSFPVECFNGRYSIVQGLKIDNFSKEKMKLTADELLEEREIAFKFLGINTN